MAIPDVEPTNLTWHPSTQVEWAGPVADDPESGANAGGVDLGYTISGADLPQGVPIQLFWGNGDAKLNQSNPITVGDDGNTIVTQTGSDASYSVHIPASSLGTPPPGTNDLIAVINPTGAVNSQGNAIVTQQNGGRAILSSSASDVLANSVHVQVSGTEIWALFMPASGSASPDLSNDLSQAKGALTLAQAAAICGVDHFNWVQHYASPSYISFYRYNTTTANLIKPDDEGSYLDPDNMVSNAADDIEHSSFANASKNFGAQPVDNYEFYYDEIDDPGLDYYGLHEEENQAGDAFGLQFYDQPINPMGYLKPLDYFLFDTTLFGSIGHNAFPLVEGGPDLEFTWHSNTAYDSNRNPTGLVWLRYVDSPDRPTDTEGGIFGVTIGGAYSVSVPPVLNVIPDEQVNAGAVVTFVALAIDTNPGATLTYSLGPGAPSGATVDPKTGVFSWNVPSSEPPGNYSVDIRVTENATPTLSDAQTFTITVDPVALAPPRIVSINIVTVKRKGTKMIDVVFNEPMNPATAGDPGDYIVVIPEKVHGKKAHNPKSTPVAFRVRYNPADDSASLILRKPTKRPLQVTVRKVVSAVNGLPLGSDYTVGVQ